jgi:hypothetical protein
MTNPPGYTILLDDQPHTAPYTVTSVAGLNRELGVPTVQYQHGSVWAFDYWSDGGIESHLIDSPVEDTTYTVNFVETGGACTLVRILQNRDDRYAMLDNGNNLSWAGGTNQQAEAEVLVRELTAQGFTLKAKSNGKYVVLVGDGGATRVAAIGEAGAMLAEEACGTDPAGFRAIRVDMNADGNPLNEVGNYWKSIDSIGLQGSCPPESNMHMIYSDF